MLFDDRTDAGRKLAAELSKYKNHKETQVLALPRGGVIVAFEVAKLLNLPLDIIVPRKIGAPFNAELAIGAISGESVFLDEALIATLNVSEDYLKRTIQKEKKEMERRETLYRQGLPDLKLQGKTVILIDDGIATGATMKAAVLSLKRNNVKKIIIATPVAPPDTVEELKEMVYEVIVLFTPINFMAIGQFYDNFEQTNDEEVIAILSKKQDKNA